jgi:predicted nucleic acid-binding protein
VIVRPQSILLDAEALSALARGEKRMQAWLEAARRTDSDLYASTATLAEVTAGTSRDARVRQVAEAIRLVEVTEDIGYTAGTLRAAAAGRRKPRDLTMDALVAATAARLAPPVVVLTSDRGDLERLLSATDALVEPV